MPPPFYPNVVTLTPAPEPALTTVRTSFQRGSSASLAVKDSFAALPLGRLGFRLLFDAQWIARPPLPQDRGDPSEQALWTRIESADALARWEATWGGNDGPRRIFLPSLLRRDDVAILNRSFGFASIGPLRVWSKEQGGGDASDPGRDSQ